MPEFAIQTTLFLNSLGFIESMHLIRFLGSEKGREASQVQCQEASQPKQWQLEVGIWDCFQFLKDSCVWRIGHHVSSRRETIFYPMVGRLMQKASSEHQFCFAISKATQLSGYRDDLSDQLSTWPHRFQLLSGFQRSAMSMFTQSVLPRWIKLSSEMRVQSVDLTDTSKHSL